MYDLVKNKRVDLNSNAYMFFDNSTGENKVSIFLNSDISGYFEFKLNQERIDALSTQLIFIISKIKNKRPLDFIVLNFDLNGFFALFRFNTYNEIEQLINTMIDLFHGYDQFVKYYFDSDNEEYMLNFKEKLDKLRSLGNN